MTPRRYTDLVPPPGVRRRGTPGLCAGARATRPGRPRQETSNGKGTVWSEPTTARPSRRIRATLGCETRGCASSATLRPVKGVVVPARTASTGPWADGTTQLIGLDTSIAPPCDASRLRVITIVLMALVHHRPVSYTHLTLPTNREV